MKMLFNILAIVLFASAVSRVASGEQATIPMILGWTAVVMGSVLR